MIYLDDLLAATGGRLLAAGARFSFPGFAHDSRQVAPGECFVAVRGPRADGHDYVEDGLAHGAGGVLVEEERFLALQRAVPDLLTRLEAGGVAVVAVEDCRQAIRRYAAHVLQAWRPTIVGVTGSTGKTTTKEAIADVLARVAPTFRSWRNYNDLLGLPLSLGGLEPGHRYAVLEMACDHPGEIQALCEIAPPTIGVVTNVSATQLQYFGGEGALAAELNQLPRALPPHGYAVLNGDDPAARAMGADTGATVRFFGPVAAEADPAKLEPRHPVRYALVPIGTGPAPGVALRPLSGPSDRPPLFFRHLHGDHWAYAVLAAATVGEALGMDPAEALRALGDLRPLPGRLNWLAGVGGITLLDDSHNSGPASTRAGLMALAALSRMCGPHAARVAVLGDMLRLGGEEDEAHRLAGRQVVELATHLVTLGPRAERVGRAAVAGGLPAERVAITHTPEDAARAALAFAGAAPTTADQPGPPFGAAHTGGLVLVKGSEELRMERVTSLLLAHPERAADLLDRQTQAWKRMVMIQPDRPTWLEVDLGAIGQNTHLIKEFVGPEVEVLVSLKADAYGHGALRVARTVLRNGAGWLGVATVSEAAPLRTAGILAPIVVFGFTAPWQAREAVRLDLRATVYEAESARALARAAQDLGREVRVHVKIDSGMGRLGLRAEDLPDILAFWEELRGLPGLLVEGVFTHLATADSADQTYARRQIARFEAVLAALDERGLRPPIVHAANSAVLLTLPATHFNLVRAGIAIYGLPPSDEVRLPDGFRPALAFKTQVAQVKEVPAGEGISYGATYVTTAPTRVATLPVGYADGFRRGPANWGEVLVRGRRAPLLGRVCMDQCMIDVTHIPGVRTGDEVVLIGRQGDDELTAEAVAARLGTIHYEVVAALLARVPRVS
jgi:alanine racemase